MFNVVIILQRLEINFNGKREETKKSILPVTQSSVTSAR